MKNTMVNLIIAVLSILAAARARIVYEPTSASAASEGQIKFAIENEYDQTGPGSKEPSYAYKTFKTLEDALVGYINDPDTKLPDHERYIAYQRLVKEPVRYHKKPEKPSIYVTRYTYPDKKIFYHEPQSQLAILDLRNVGEDNNQRTAPKYTHYKKYTESTPKPASLAQNTEEDVILDDKFDPNPHYTFSYGVHDKETGDSKTAHESREDGVVKGYYTLMDADGKQRTVHYTADDKQGFRAVVQRTPSNSHAAP